MKLIFVIISWSLYYKQALSYIKNLLLSRTCLKPLHFRHFEFFITQSHEPWKSVKTRPRRRTVNGSKIRLIKACQARLSLFVGPENPIR